MWSHLYEWSGALQRLGKQKANKALKKPLQKLFSVEKLKQTQQIRIITANIYIINDGNIVSSSAKCYIKVEPKEHLRPLAFKI